MFLSSSEIDNLKKESIIQLSRKRRISMKEITRSICEQLKTVNHDGNQVTKTFEVNKLYGMFFSDHSFQFAVDTLLPKSTYERMLYSAFGDVPLLPYTSVTLSWDDAWRDEVFMPVGEDAAIVVRGSKMIPSHLITGGQISFEDLVKAYYAVVEVVASDPSFLDDEFKCWQKYSKRNPLITTINLALKDSYGVCPIPPKKPFSRFRLCQEKNAGKLVSVENLYGLFADNRSFTFAIEKHRYDERYQLLSPFTDEPVMREHRGTVRGYHGLIENNILSRKIAIEAPKLIPPQLLSTTTIDRETLLEIQGKIKDLVDQYPELLNPYFPVYKRPDDNVDILTTIGKWLSSSRKESPSEKQYHK